MSPPNWAGSRIRADALSVPCRYCLAEAGKGCVAKKDRKPLDAFPAHTIRISDAQKAWAK